MSAHDPGSMGLDEKVAALSRKTAYPTSPRQVERVETHWAYVFLADEYVWKLKKPMKTEFFDFSTPEKRRIDCEEEVRLNRRLAGDIYLGVSPLTRTTDGEVRMGGSGEVVDWLVKMQRLPRQRSLEASIQAGRARPEDVAGVARLLGDFYRRAARPVMAEREYPDRLIDEIQANGRELACSQFELDADSVAALTQWQYHFVRSNRELLESRQRMGWVVEAHGDLRPEHIFLLDRPVIIDCLEFNRDLRILDAASELTFLGLECDRLQAHWVEQTVLRSYCGTVGDCPPAELRTFYRVWHACSRAKVALWHLHDGPANSTQWKEKAREYLRLAAASVRSA